MKETQGKTEDWKWVAQAGQTRGKRHLVQTAGAYWEVNERAVCGLTARVGWIYVGSEFDRCENCRWIHEQRMGGKP